MLGAQDGERYECPSAVGQPAARAALKEVRDAEGKEHLERALKAFIKDYEAKWPKATEKIAKDKVGIPLSVRHRVRRYDAREAKKV